MQPADDLIASVHASTDGPLRSQVLRSARGDQELADDIMQDTWLRAVVTWRTKGVPDRPAAWLATVARNLLLNAQRNRRRFSDSAPQLLNAIPDNSPRADLSGSLESIELYSELHAARSRLPSMDQALITRFYDERMSVASIAASMGVTDRAVEARLRRARKKLRAELEDIRRCSSKRSQLPLLYSFGLNPKLPFVKRFAMSAALPYLAIVALAPLAFLVQRLPRRRLALLRVSAGLVLFVVATVSAPTAARPFFVQILQLGAIGLVGWGLWMLRAPTRRDPGSPDRSGALEA
jgi:RNA polymerase sigma-70 factor (ECF subfamily)